jgi:hypothetical protein
MIATPDWDIQCVRSVRSQSVGLAGEFARSVGSRLWVFDGEKLPWVGDAFERMGAAISESHP